MCMWVCASVHACACGCGGVGGAGGSVHIFSCIIAL